MKTTPGQNIVDFNRTGKARAPAATRSTWVKDRVLANGRAIESFAFILLALSQQEEYQRKSNSLPYLPTQRPMERGFVGQTKAWKEPCGLQCSTHLKRRQDESQIGFYSVVPNK